MTTITAFDGGTFDAYLALPPSGRGPGIVLLQEIFGVNQDCVVSPIGMPRMVTPCFVLICSGGRKQAFN